MKRTSIRRALVPGIAIAALSLAGCAASNEGDAAAADGDGGSLSGTMAGGGSSAQEAAQAAWIAGFQTANPDVTISYDPVGSGGGREGFISGGFAFAGSDSYLTDDEGELSAAAENCGGDPIEVPNYISPIAVIYNVEGVDDLQLSPATLTDIFNGSITKWNDPAIAADNGAAELPDATINAVHRSDESGTTKNFTDYLAAVAPDAWPDGAVELWPEPYGGEGAKGTSGVVAAVQNGENSIGYADASQAGDLSVALIGVGDEFIAPSADAAAKLLEVSPQVEDRPDVDIAFDIDHTTEESGVYPIVLTSYLLACQQYDDAATADLVKGYLGYILSEEGQQQGADEAGSAPLPSALREQAAGIVDAISAGE